jgi:hypothetical protein
MPNKYLTCIGILAVFACATARAEEADTSAQAAPAAAGGAANEANNPLTPKITLNLQDYYDPTLNRLPDTDANQFLLRGLIPAKAFGIPQLIRFTLPIATAPTASGSRTGLGDLTLMDLAVFPVSKGLMIGAGPLLVAPTATDTATGAGKWQAGFAGVVVAPQSWGLLAGLVTYQHSFAGDTRHVAEVLVAQPIVTVNLPDGLYLRSSGSWTFDRGNHSSYVPVGLGVGKVWTYGAGNNVNAFVEPQITTFRSGVGVPKWQIFAGMNFQFALGPR